MSQEKALNSSLVCPQKPGQSSGSWHPSRLCAVAMDSCTARRTAIARRPWTREAITTSFRGRVDLEDRRRHEHGGSHHNGIGGSSEEAGSVKAPTARVGADGARSLLPNFITEVS